MRVRKAKNSAKEPVRLHLGAFDRSIPGWVNTDITTHIFISRIPLVSVVMHKFNMNLTKPLPIRNETVGAIFSSHVFEHLFIDEVLRLVKEIKRILIPGGVCRVVVPDLEKILKVFDPQDPSEFLKDVFEATSRSRVKNHHITGFTGSFRKFFGIRILKNISMSLQKRTLP